MHCPRCASDLVYSEDIHGVFLYPLRNGLIVFGQRTFDGDSLDHRITCTHPECAYVLPPEEFSGIFLRSVGEE